MFITVHKTVQFIFITTVHSVMTTVYSFNMLMLNESELY